MGEAARLARGERHVGRARRVEERQRQHQVVRESVRLERAVAPGEQRAAVFRVQGLEPERDAADRQAGVHEPLAEAGQQLGQPVRASAPLDKPGSQIGDRHDGFLASRPIGFLNPRSRTLSLAARRLAEHGQTTRVR
jgi:hypothetical protein